MTLEKDRTAALAGKSDDVQVTWHSLQADEVLKRLGAEPHSGISSAEAQERLAKYGPNELAAAPGRTFIQMLLEQLKGFVIWLLIGAAIISAVLGDWVEAVAILAIVILNAVMGVVQESRAEQALEALKKLAAPDAQVLRDGRRQTVPARLLVPGDIVFLEAGNYIPADLRLVEAVNLRVGEAALTGESVPVEKNASLVMSENASLGDRRNTAFMGTVVSYGRGQGVVTSTGMLTQIGMIATMLSAVEQEQTPLQRRLDQLGKTLGWAAMVVAVIVFGAGVLQGGSLLDMFMVAVSLAIAAVPEGLPAIVTISLALGMREMIQRNALIRRLSSVETLGSATVICSDKTGTLTQNEMTVTRIWADGRMVEVTGSGYQPEGEFRLDGQLVDRQQNAAIGTALWLGTLNNDSQLEKTEDGTYRIIGDPTEGSLLVAAAKAGAWANALAHAYPRTAEIPFDSERKRMVTFHEVREPKSEDISPFDTGETGNYVVAVKGAPDIVLRQCTHYLDINDEVRHPLDDAARQRILSANDDMTKEALRVLGVAFRVIDHLPGPDERLSYENDLTFVGLLGMIDPARSEVKDAHREAVRAGIRTIMITGDYPNTAKAIAEGIGILRPGHQVLPGADLDSQTDEQLRETVKVTDVFARVSPEHKMRIVDALRANGEVVAMTGDGVNDAPAIKRADIGVAMGITGTDVAKETADMVLTDDNYASIVSAVEQGRIIYSNIRKFVNYLISCNLAEIFIIFLPTVLGRFMYPYAQGQILSPLEPIQILWINLLTDGAPALALGTEKGDPDIMEQPPRPSTEPIINRQMTFGVIVQVIAIATVTLVAFGIGLRQNAADIHLAETMAFVTLSTSELVRAFAARSERYPIINKGIFGNKWMNIAVVVSLVLMLFVVYVPFLNTIFGTLPLAWDQWKLILPLVFVPGVAAEVSKAIQLAFSKRRQA